MKEKQGFRRAIDNNAFIESNEGKMHDMGTLTRLHHAWRACVQVKADAQRRSERAFDAMLAAHPEVPLEPRYGPVERVEPMARPGPMIPDKYHIVVAADCNIYMGWQMLVRRGCSQNRVHLPA